MQTRSASFLQKEKAGTRLNETEVLHLAEAERPAESSRDEETVSLHSTERGNGRLDTAVQR